MGTLDDVRRQRGYEGWMELGINGGYKTVCLVEKMEIIRSDSGERSENETRFGGGKLSCRCRNR